MADPPAAGDRGVDVHRRVVDQHVDPAEGRRGVGGEPLHLRGVGQVGAEQRVPLAVEAGEDRLGALAGAAVVHDDPVAAGGEGAGGGGADPAGGAGDQDAATGVVHAGQPKGRSRTRVPGEPAAEPLPATTRTRAHHRPTRTVLPAGCLTVAG